jgi:hypothetical protein
MLSYLLRPGPEPADLPKGVCLCKPYSRSEDGYSMLLRNIGTRLRGVTVYNISLLPLFIYASSLRLAASLECAKEYKPKKGEHNTVYAALKKTLKHQRSISFGNYMFSSSHACIQPPVSPSARIVSDDVPM